MDGWYFSNVTYTCELCHPICKTCYGPDPNNCLTCDPLATLYRSTCSCPSTKYKTSTNTCEDCSLSCLNCVSSPTYCTSCREPKILSGSTCVCPDSHYTDVDGNCYPYVCHPSCLTCKGTTSSDCTSCTKSYEYYMNSFQCKCIEGYFMHTDGKCYPCDNKCQTCATLTHELSNL
jgi:proprotein convertase subtilisin/kexin type 5